MELLDNPVRNYAWGSRTTIASVRGLPVPSPQPEAELWMGAHPDDPSMVVRDGRRVALTALIDADPDTVLGAGTVHRFGRRLPFLVKLLAAEQPLSIQAHPDAARARQGHAAQAGLPADDPRRLYRDPYHKPELLVAVEPFDALCGFRHPDTARDVLASLRMPVLDPVIEMLSDPDPARALRGATEALLCWPATEHAGLVAAVADAVGADGSAVDEPWLDRYAVERQILVDLVRRYPADMGVLVALLLNPVRLSPGEAIWMPAGNPHAYLHGAGVEIMAASDNVLRGGLTPKHVDVTELLRVLRYEVLDDPVVRPVELGAGLVTWPVPAEEFSLVRADVRPGSAVRLPGAGPRIVFCLGGRVALSEDGPGVDADGSRSLARGESVFVPAPVTGLTCRGEGVLFQAAVPAAAAAESGNPIPAF